jgi:hypothetical protein
MLSSHIRLGLPSDVFPSDVLTFCYAVLLSSIDATCPAHLILPDSLVLIALGEEYKSGIF